MVETSAVSAISVFKCFRAFHLHFILEGEGGSVRDPHGYVRKAQEVLTADQLTRFKQSTQRKEK